jgi:hypothetical protein
MKTLVTVAVVAIVVLGVWSFASADHRTLVEPSDALRASEDPATEYGSEPPGGSDRSPAEPPRVPESARNFELDLKVGAKGFRLGGRLFGPAGVTGAWLNGEMRPEGFSLDGRVQGDGGRVYNFKVDAEALDRLTRAGWLWFLQRSLGD